MSKKNVSKLFSATKSITEFPLTRTISLKNGGKKMAL